MKGCDEKNKKHKLTVVEDRKRIESQRNQTAPIEPIQLEKSYKVKESSRGGRGKKESSATKESESKKVDALENEPTRKMKGHRKKFNVTEAMERFSFRERLSMEDDIKIINFNVGGLRSPYKKESLRSMAFHLKFSVGVITETHLTEEEMNALVIPGYTIIDKSGNNVHKGGVMILVDANTKCKKLEVFQKPSEKIDACGAILYPTGDEGYQIRITGIYIPPSIEATAASLKNLVDEKYQISYSNGDMISHLIIGDFNPNSWKRGPEDRYSDWIAEEGLWDLSHPKTATYATGSALDKFILKIGRDVPAEWLPPERISNTEGEWEQGIGEVNDEEFYPTVTFPEPWIDDHHPVMLTLKGKYEKEFKAFKRLRVDHLSKEDWIEKDEQMRVFVDDNKTGIQNSIAQNNGTRLLDIISRGIEKVFHKENRTKKKETEPIDPFLLFCKRHKEHPEYPILINAIQEDNFEQVHRSMELMSRDGWKEYLKTIRASDISAFFKYLAKEDGRKSRVVTYSCAAPLQDPEGNRKFTGKEKCQLLADFYEKKLRQGKKNIEGKTREGHDGNHGDRKAGRPSASQTSKRKKYLPHIKDRYLPIQSVELKRALKALQKGKAPGPDGFVVEIYQNVSCLHKLIVNLFDIILSTGNIPLQLRKLTIVPLDKPLKNPEHCKSKRPVSLLCVLAKALEVVVLHRMQNSLEQGLDGRQYAYRQGRGTETHLLEFFDFVKETRDKGCYVYVASIDVDSAFDTVPHEQLLKTTEKLGVDPYIRRYLHGWLTGRMFTVRIQTSKGRFFSTWRPIRRGVPQGGVLSPFLWLLHIDGLFQKVEMAKQGYSPLLSNVIWCHLIYADDVLCALAHEHQEIVISAAHQSADTHSTALSELGLGTTQEKSVNFLVPPSRTEDSFFRRSRHEQEGKQTPRTRNKSQDEEMRAEKDNETFGTQRTDPETDRPVLPYGEVEQFKLLGIEFDKGFTFEGHLQKVLGKAKMRLAILSKVSSYTWGLETGVLRATGKALVTSLLRYGLAVIGSGLTERNMRLLDTRVTNVLARKICGVGQAARLPILHAASGTMAVHNLFIQRCAEMLNIALKAENSSIQQRLRRWLGKAYGVETWEATVQTLEVPQELLPQIGRLKYLDYEVQENWVFNVLPQLPKLQERFLSRSTFYCGAAEIRERPNLRALTYDFTGMQSWFEVGTQIAAASGWRPDCSKGLGVDCRRALPPRESDPRRIFLSYADMDDQVGMEEIANMDPCATMQINDKGLLITTAAFFQEGIGVSAAWIKEPGKVPYTQIWALGTDNVSESPPAFVLEGSLLHALCLVEQQLQKSDMDLDYIKVMTGNWLTSRKLQWWFERGELKFESAALFEIMSTIHRLAQKLKCSLTILPMPSWFFEKTDRHSEKDSDAIATAVRRFYQMAIPLARKKWGCQLARLPWTTEEYKKQLRKKYKEGEREAIGFLAAQGSDASMIFCRLRLTREIIKETLRRLQNHRKRQTALAGILCATRFKFFTKKGSLLKVKCANNCGEVETFDHLLQCNGLCIPEDTEDVEKWINFLWHMATRASKTLKVIPEPVSESEMEVQGEISLEIGEGTPDDIEDSLSILTLSFD